MTGTVTDLTVAGRLALRALGRRLAGKISPPPDLDGFRREMKDALARLPTGTVANHAWVRLPADEPPWRDSGVALAPGDEATYFAVGRVYASRGLDLWITPKFQIWSKIGDGGEIISATRNSNTIKADRAGALHFGNYAPNDWVDPTGNRLHDDKVYEGAEGETLILVVHWVGSAQKGLATLQATADSDGVVASEIERLEQGPTAPDGWHYLWNLGDAEIFRDGHTPEGAPAVCCEVQADVGILQKEVDLPLVPGTELSWRWIVENLPSDIREDSIPSHDYLSIAVEFDNGWDLTYYWSCALKPGTGYICPLPNWKHREFHVVVRSGPKGLGEWVADHRNVYDDYQHYMKDLGPAPTRIVRVWFIANSTFQRGLGKCAFADIKLTSDGQEIAVL